MLERRAPHRPAHLLLIRDWMQAGKIELAGALGDPPHGGAFVFAVDDPAEIERFVASDPYVGAGLVVERRVDVWNLIER